MIPRMIVESPYLRYLARPITPQLIEFVPHAAYKHRFKDKYYNLPHWRLFYSLVVFPQIYYTVNYTAMMHIQRRKEEIPIITAKTLKEGLQ